MASSPEDPSVKYEIYSATDAEDMTRLLGDVFSCNDPPAYAVGVTASEFAAFVELLCPKAAAEELTVIARESRTGDLVGAMLTEDFASDLPEGLDRISPKFDPIFDILGQLDEDYRANYTFRPGVAIHLLLLGVAERFAGRGIAQRLVEQSLAHAVTKGYRTAVTEATNKVSQHIFRKLGFVDRVTRAYKTHRFEGSHPFKSVAEHGGPILMDRSLEV